jgi:hypothetical protein
MSFQRKLIVVALASVIPMMSAHAQSAADLQKEIAALKAQLQALTQKVEAVSKQADTTPIAQQVTRIEQKMDLADDEAEKSGFKGVKINGTIEATYLHDSTLGSNDFGSSSGFFFNDAANAGFGMLQISKQTQDDQGIDWTLRVLPGAGGGGATANTESFIHEASLSIPVDKENRIIAGVIPDWSGYELAFPNANSTLGNQLITHNALYDLVAPVQYRGVGMSHTFDGGKYALKWVVGNVDTSIDNAAAGEPYFTGGTSNHTISVAYRGDWYINEYSYVGLSGLHGANNREFNVMAVDGGFTRGDWQFNGQLSFGNMAKAAFNSEDASWTGLSGYVGFKATPRLQLIGRADYIDNSKNGGGTYYVTAPSATIDSSSTGLGPELDATGFANDPNLGASLTRISLGTNYQINSNTQWKLEYRLDQSSGYNFWVDGNYSKSKNIVATSLMLSF